MRRLGLIAVSILASNLAYAGSMGSVCEASKVTVPCASAKWDFGIQALNLRPVFDADRSYVFNTFFGDLQRGFGTTYYRSNYIDWDWGFRLEGSYHFNTGNDLTVDWSHYKSDSAPETNRRFDGGPLILIWDTPLRTQQNFDQVNVVLGQHTDFGLFKNIRFYGGLQYAKIKDNVRVSRTTTLANGVFALSNNYGDETEFSGVGPVIGIDYQYELGNGLSVTAKGQSSILYGNQRQQDFLTTTSLPTQWLTANKHNVVPSVEAKLGVNYVYAMSSGSLNLQAGYQIVNYFNALQGYLAFTAPPTLPTSVDFGLYGPYFGAKWIGEVL